jgi:MFS family permease
MARLLTGRTDRRRAAAASYVMQAIGTLLLWIAGPEHVALLLLGVVLFGLGIGNATSLPPLIAQAEFAPVDVPRVVARSVALSQALYAFAPAVLAALMVGGSRATPSWGADTGACFFVIVALQALAASCIWAGSGRTASDPGADRPVAAPCAAPRSAASIHAPAPAPAPAAQCLAGRCR